MITSIRFRTLILLLVLAISGIFTACDDSTGVGLNDAGLAFESEPQAWIDAPLDKSRLPLAPYQVVFHITDPVRVDLGELRINDAVVELLTNPDPVDKMVTMRYEWVPEAPGEYLLEARAQNGEGVWSAPDTALVIIGDDEQEKATTPEVDEEPETEETEEPEAPEKPTKEEEGKISEISALPKTVSYGVCSPTQVTISAQAVDPVGITGVSIFYRLRDTKGTTTGWLNVVMTPKGSDVYERTISLSSTVDQLGFAGKGGKLEYQIVVQNDLLEFVRSKIKKDVTVSACKSPVILPLSTVQPEPTKTPIVIK